MKPKIKNIKIMTHVIEANVLIERPRNRLIKFVFASNSIDSVVLDLQELYPESGINRASILSWKFLTNNEYAKLQQEMKSPSLPSTEQEAKVSDTTDDDSSNVAG